MRILQVNKFNYLRGGAEKYFLSVSEELRRRGNEVAIFSMQHPKNLKSDWEKYFVSRVSFNEGSIVERLIGALRALYSFEAKRKFEELVKEFKPEIIHLHNIYHQISPSILSVAKKYHIPVIMHLHDYKLISGNYQLYCRGRVCYDGTAPDYWKCFFKKCFRDSYAASFLVSLEMWFHHKILKIYERGVRRYIAPSFFMKDTCVRFGVAAEKISVLYNFIETDQVETSDGGYLLYFGRLSPEKGIDVLLRAVARERVYPLKIAGAGPDEERLKGLALELGLNKEVEFLGHKDSASLALLIRNATAVVIPSVWLENMPFSLLESLGMGKVAIVSRIGGLAEIIKDGVNGFSFSAGNVEELSKAFTLLKNADLSVLTTGARQSVQDLTLSRHVDDLLKLYESTLK